MKRLLLAALLAGVASTAMAADLPSHKAPPAAPAYYPPVFTWTGFYAGINGGWGGATGGGGDFGSATGGLIGGTVGYNYQIGQFVIGAESDLDWADISKSGWNGLAGGYAYKTNADTLFTARARAGYAIDRALFYVTGGYAGADVKLSQYTYGSKTDWRSGGVIGAGAEYAFTNHISAKVEYLYEPLQDKDFAGGKSKLDLSLVRAGLNYKF